MLDSVFKRHGAVEGLRRNPLGRYLDSFAAWVSDLGFSRSTVQGQLWLLAKVGKWLERNGFGATDLDETLVERLLVEVTCRGRQNGDESTLRRFLSHLRSHGVIPFPPVPTIDKSPLATLEDRYATYLRTERGLSPVTAAGYQPFLRCFLRERFGDAPLRLQEIRAQDISRFVLRHAHSRTPKTAQLMVTALRSFFRFLDRQGETQSDLSAAVPTVSSWRLAEIPKYLGSDEIKRVLDACDRNCAVGRRNYAILLLLARLGLRAGEIVALELEDIDWRGGELMVRGKGQLHDRLPLPQDVGEALAAYLRNDRPRSLTRRVFVRTRAPHRGFNHASTVCSIVRRTVKRAGLNPPLTGAHLLRHSLATSMIRRGASLAEIGEVLRHRTTNSTEIYAKVDIEGLRSIAQPWPAAGGCDE